MTKIEVFEIDNNGFIIERYVKDESVDLPSNIVRTRPLDGLYRARWTGIEWVEDMTQEEIDSLNNTIKEPTLEDKVVEQELVINDLTQLLIDKGVIY